MTSGWNRSERRKPLITCWLRRGMNAAAPVNVRAIIRSPFSRGAQMGESAAARRDDGPDRFGVFDFDAATLELRKNSRPLRVRPQSLKLLALLVARPGELITREEIQQTLWGNDTFVDYEQGVNHSIKELRAALGDSSGSPRFIETLPRRGYRFIAPIEKCGPSINRRGNACRRTRPRQAPARHRLIRETRSRRLAGACLTPSLSDRPRCARELRPCGG